MIYIISLVCAIALVALFHLSMMTMDESIEKEVRERLKKEEEK